MDFTTLRPFSWLQFHPLYAKEWSERLGTLVEEVAKKDVGKKELAEFGFSSGVWRDQLLFLLFDLKSARVEKKKRLTLARFFNEALHAVLKGDYYGLHGSNVGHSEQEVKRMLHEIPWEPGKPEHSRLVGKLYTAAIHLVNGLYGDIYTGYGTDNFGSYDASGKYGKGHILVIRHFGDLKPVDLWASAQELPCKSMDIYTVYKDVQFTCDAISCHSIFKGDVLEGLVDFAVNVDGKFVDSFAEMEALKDKLMHHSVRQWQELTSLNFEQTKRKGLLQRCFVFKKVFEKAGMDWRPTKGMREAVRNKPFADENYWGVPTDKTGRKREFWKKAMDPRIDFYPKG